MNRLVWKWRPVSPLVICLALLVGCGDAGQGIYAEEPSSGGMNDGQFDDTDEGNDDGAPDEDFEPEEEEFLVQQVAATDSYVFVPNQSEESDTVALIDGWDFSVHPIQVGLQPTQVVAADVEDQGSVGYVLSTGQPTVSVVRAEQGQGSSQADVHILPVPREVNQLALAPGGRHVLAYIDPDLPINDSASAASLQTMALIRLGDEPGEDEVFELSVTRLINDIAFTEDGTEAFVIGEEGINRLALDEIKSDAFLPSLDLGLGASVFPPQDQQVDFSADGSVLAMRTSQYAGVGIFELKSDDAVIERSRLVEMSGVPTDLSLVEAADGGSLMAVATLRSEHQVVLFDVEEALDAEDEDDSFLRHIDTEGADAGIGRLTPDESSMVVFSTLPQVPTVGLVDLETETIETFELRNEIRNLAISADSRTAVVVHKKQSGSTSGSDPEETFRRSEGITLWDLETGFRRPIALDGEPEEIVMVNDGAGTPYLYVMLTSSNAFHEGIKRINLSTHSTEFVRLSRTPMQLGVVGEQVFVSQEQETGRITFLDVNTKAQRTVSGYELNAGIQ